MSMKHYSRHYKPSPKRKGRCEMGIVFAGFAIGLATGLSIGVLSTLAWVDYREGWK
jgi:hypothetical protein